jgi:demethylmenaquinone methyltransferase/2-methoxy-6-polyprenyl-1,4-benzoquinol methylase
MSRAAQIRFLSRTAPLYDPVVRALRFPRLWDAVARHAAPAEGTPCLDVCTGTGGVALALARRGAEVTGIDLADGMLAHAARRAARAGLAGRASFLAMDARHLAFPDAAFPVVTCAMGLHEMADAERLHALREIRRVARDRVLVAEYAVPPRGPRRLAFRALHAFEYVESDDFGGFLARSVRARLEEVGLAVRATVRLGAYGLWCCRVPR